MITVSGEPQAASIKVDGWLDGGGAAELRHVVDAMAGPVRLSLSDLRGADAEGVALLRRLAAEGVPFDGLSPYIALMVAEAPASEAHVKAGNTRTETSAGRRRSA